jgi:1,4-dihydroxy-2-naphthoyl-CoA hydrolase
MSPRPTFEVFDAERARKMVGVRSTSGIDGFLGIMLTSLEAGRLTAEMPVTPEVMTFIGNMHGGCLSAFCDHVLGTVMYPIMPAGSWAATTEFKLNLLAPVTKGVCTATAEVIAMTRRMSVVRIDIENEGRLVAAAQGTCTIVAPKAA